MTTFGGQSFGLSTPMKNQKQAVKAQDAYIRQAGAARRLGYDTAIGNWNDTMAPYKGFGGQQTQNWSNLLNNPSQVTSDPGYEFARSQGQTGVENSAAAKGGLLSGNALRAISGYNQDYASNQYDKALGRYQKGAQFGATIDTNLSNALAQLNVAKGNSNAQEFGDYSNYAFWQEQQGMDEAKQWMGFLRGALGGQGGSSPSSAAQPKGGKGGNNEYQGSSNSYGGDFGGSLGYTGGNGSSGNSSGSSSSDSLTSGMFNKDGSYNWGNMNMGY